MICYVISSRGKKFARSYPALHCQMSYLRVSPQPSDELYQEYSDVNNLYSICGDLSEIVQLVGVVSFPCYLNSRIIWNLLTVASTLYGNGWKKHFCIKILTQNLFALL